MSNSESSTPESTIRQKDYLENQFRKVEKFEVAGGTADVIAHSDGAVNTVIAATLYPQKFRNIVLFGPAGLMGQDTFIRLLKGFAQQKEVTATALKEAVKYFAKNPVRAITEGRDLANSQIHEMLYSLHDKGIGIVVISGVDDPAFPMERMQQIVKTGMLDGFLSVLGAHGEIGNHPKLYMGAAEEMLTKLEAKKAIDILQKL